MGSATGGPEAAVRWPLVEAWRSEAASFVSRTMSSDLLFRYLSVRVHCLGQAMAGGLRMGTTAEALPRVPWRRLISPGALCSILKPCSLSLAPSPLSLTPSSAVSLSYSW